MQWLKLISLALNLVNGIVTLFRQRQLISAGEAKQIAEGLKVTNERIVKARKARERAYNSDPDPNDPYARD